MKDGLDKKIEFIKAIENCGIKYGTYKLRFIQKGKYGKPEVWLYHNPNPKQRRMNAKGHYLVYPDGTPVMESKTGLLIEEETINDKEYLKSYLENCF
jgi:hypothetical protein